MPNNYLSSDNSTNDIIQTACNKIGSRLGDYFVDLIDLVFGPLHYYSEKKRIVRDLKHKEFLELTGEKIESIPDGDLTVPDPQVFCEILEKSKYCVYREEARDMFSNLLANTASSTYSSFVHPTFAEIIRQINPEDSRLFVYLNKHVQIPIGILSVESIPDYLFLLDEPDEAPPLLSDIQSSGTIIIPTVADVPVDICESKNLPQAIENLSRLGLIKINFFVHCEDDDYHSLKELPVVTDVMDDYSLPEGSQFFLHRGSCSVTALGSNFAKVCM